MISFEPAGVINKSLETHSQQYGCRYRRENPSSGSSYIFPQSHPWKNVLTPLFHDNYRSTSDKRHETKTMPNLRRTEVRHGGSERHITTPNQCFDVTVRCTKPKTVRLHFNECAYPLIRVWKSSVGNWCGNFERAKERGNKSYSDRCLLPHPNLTLPLKGRELGGGFLPLQGGGQEGDGVMCRSRTSIRFR